MEFLYNLIIEPLILIIEIVFGISYRVLNNMGVAIICVSIAVSILTIPLYKRADAIQEKERQKKGSMKRWEDHINKTFKGDERFMLLNTYYRQQNYKPVYALRSSLSLLLQIPFFIAAYRYLSSLKMLEGVSFLLINNLGKPDEILKIGNIHINILPITMTLINCISGAIYSRGFSVREKVQMYGIAGVFLVLLYNRPSGLVLYWTMNNVFSLIKNILTKLVKNSEGVILIGPPVIGISFFLYLLFTGRLVSAQRTGCALLIVLVSFMPLLTKIKSVKCKANEKRQVPNLLIFILGSVFITVLLGVLIPSGVISASPLEFVNVNQYKSPMQFIVHTFAISSGFFLVWAGVLYYLAEKEGKRGFECIFWCFSIIFLLDFMVFGKKLGTVSTTLIFDSELSFSMGEIVCNFLLVGILFILGVFVWKRKNVLVKNILFIMVIVIAVQSGINIYSIHNDLAGIKKSKSHEADELEPIIHLSTKGKNVVVFMLDRAIGSYIPYIFNEKPELKEIFSGFTYYANTISYGLCTNYAAPALFGGYEYTPLEMNRRDDELLQIKNDEALKLMPAIFWENGYEVTVCDPPYAGYKWIPDLSIYDDYPGVKTYNTEGAYTNTVNGEYIEYSEKLQKRNFWFYSLLKTAPVFLQPIVYDTGDYFSTASEAALTSDFLNNFSVLKNLSELTVIDSNGENTFFIINNKTAHSPVILQMPDYEPVMSVNNSEYENEERFTVDGRTMKVETEMQLMHYHVNMASYLQLAEWIQYMKDNKVYDNTRIIIVSDHGYRLRQFSEWDLWDDNEIECLNPAFLVKDFDQKEYTVSYDFMTNADVPSLAFADIIDNPINPFTGNPINTDEKYSDVQYVNTNWYWDISENNGTILKEGNGHWYSVHDSIFDPDNWKQLEGQPE